MSASLLFHMIVMGSAMILSIAAVVVAKSSLVFKKKIVLHKLFAGFGGGLIALALLGLVIVGHLYPSLVHFYTGIGAAAALIIAIGGGLMVLTMKQADKRKRIRSGHVVIGAVFIALMLTTIVAGVAVLGAFFSA
ncbi:MAG: hypothetical protein N3A02_07775 [Rectinema sp.]|nr:hypothetical protein [Rectinema sp.]